MHMNTLDIFQVCRVAVMTLGEMFQNLKRHLEADLEKTVIPLVLKSGDTNKFLREDCHVALDHVVENMVGGGGSSGSKLITVLTGDLVSHKNPVVRTTTSRLLAYVVDRLGVSKALSGTKDVTDRLLPAIAKLAQDGGQEARNYAKSTLHRMMVEHEDFERILKKHLSPNMMRNLEKVIEALKNPNPNLLAGSSSIAGKRGRVTLNRRRGGSRKTL